MLPLPHARALQDSSALQDDLTYNHVYFDATVREITKLQDVEMTDIGKETEVYLVLDTNVLLQHLDVIRQFCLDIERQSLPLLVIIPRMVLSELDRQKNRKDLAWFARRATAWILEKTKEGKTLRGQRRGEECSTQREAEAHRQNDLAIVDCAEYFTRRHDGSHTFMCSGDKNLCIECEFRDIRTVVASQKEWSSRGIMAAMFPQFSRLDKFSTHKRDYRPSSKVQAQNPRSSSRKAGQETTADDSMDIDDDSAATEVLLPSHALDSLHIQIIEHFRGLLQSTALRIGGPSLAKPSTVRSAHAPAYASKPYYQWTTAEALEYLELKRGLPPSNPRLEVFMAVPHTGVRGARRGQDWPRQAWEEALAALAALGKRLDDGALLESVSVLPYHCEYLFHTPMRPTGM